MIGALAGAALVLAFVGIIAATLGDYLADQLPVPSKLPSCWHPRVTPVYLELTGEYVGDLCHSCGKRVEPSRDSQWW